MGAQMICTPHLSETSPAQASSLFRDKTLVPAFESEYTRLDWLLVLVLHIVAIPALYLCPDVLTILSPISQ